LSLYPVDRETGRADLEHPLVADQPAFDGFSLRTGRLAWNAPTDDGKAALKVWAWSGDTRGELRLATERGVTIVP
jgi:hypothetical protein